jgi:uncharacterized membrane protein YfcA
VLVDNGGVLLAGLVLAGLIVALGSLVQGMVGFGMALVAAPLLALVDPALVPIPLLVVAASHSVLTVGRELSATDWSGVGWAMLGRAPGTVLGVLAVTQLPQREFTVVVALSVLACVLLSVVSWRPRPTPRALLIAGAAGGATGTSASIGGPPVALLYQHAEGARVRATMGAYFVLGSVTSVIGLAVAGAVTTAGLLTGAALIPFMLAGFLLSGPARRLLDNGWIRPAVLLVASLSAAVLLVRALL